jgi:hypothetical protein
MAKEWFCFSLLLPSFFLWPACLDKGGGPKVP